MASELTQEERDQFHSVYETAKSLQRAYTDAPGGSEAKALAWAAAAEWRNANRSIRAKLFSVYWLGVTEAKDRRKVVKRNVMTLGYGGTQYGMGQQIIDDTRDMSEYLRDKEHLWGALLGNLVYDTCYEKLPGPAMMLRLFESLAKLSSDRGEDLCWTAPITGFPIVQSYRKPKEIRVKLSYGEEELKIQLQQWETAVLDKSAQETGSSPNIVHSFDAAHLGTVVNSAKYPVSVVHDSFGCHAGNMHDLFHLVREKFLMFYSYDPLAMILEENNAMHLMPERGSLDINLILQSDFAFV
jgi:DNA-directed RNA polymerase